MEYRTLGRSGLKVSTMTMGTMTFGGRGGFSKLGATDVEGATRQIDLCVDHGVNLVDTADMYSAGVSEEIVGQATKNHRDDLFLATKCRFPMGTARTTPARRASTSSRASRTACAASTCSTSTSSSSTAGTA